MFYIWDPHMFYMTYFLMYILHDSLYETLICCTCHVFWCRFCTTLHTRLSHVLYDTNFDVGYTLLFIRDSHMFYITLAYAWRNHVCDITHVCDMTHVFDMTQWHEWHLFLVIRMHETCKTYESLIHFVASMKV